ncbi:MAG: ABC transporter substrate-binding protein [Clostridia bacterium]|nr:ABC transporter substrate-binding protein [Clostridia bacterium]
MCNKTVRKLALFFIVFSLVLTLTACAKTVQTTTSPESATLRLAALKGPTGIGLVKLMADHDAGLTRYDYTFSLSATPDDVVALVSSGQVDIAALPTNVAAILYQKTNQSIQLLAVNTLGVLYILENGDRVHSIEDLAGRTLFATGQGAVPEYVIRELLEKAGIADQVTVTYKTEHEELATLAAADKVDLVMLPEPFVTSVLNKNKKMRIALDLTSAWKSMHQNENQSELAMGCMIVNKEFAKKYPQAIATFLEEYKESVDFVNQNPQKAGEWVAQYGIMGDAKLAAQAIPNCHIVCISGEDMKPILEPFFKILYAANPASIGGSLPDDEFYYIP